MGHPVFLNLKFDLNFQKKTWACCDKCVIINITRKKLRFLGKQVFLALHSFTLQQKEKIAKRKINKFL